MTYGFWYPRLFCWWRPYCLSSDLYSTQIFTVRRVSFFDSQCIRKNITKSQHRFYGKTLKHPGAEPRFYGKTFKFWMNISVRNDCIFNCFKGRLPQKPQICANLLASDGVQTSQVPSTGVTTSLPSRSDKSLAAIFLRLTCEPNHISSVFDGFSWRRLEAHQSPTAFGVQVCARWQL